MTADLHPEEFRRLGHAVVDWIADHRAGLDALPAQPTVEPGWVRAQLPASLPEDPAPLDALLDTVDRVVVPASTHWQHPRFFGYFPANASLHSLLGDMVSGSFGAQVALLAALHRADPRWRETGVTGAERVYVTAETHSSLAKAARVAGLGARALRTV